MSARACTSIPAQRDEDEHRQPRLEALATDNTVFCSAGASGEPNVVAVRQKLYRVVWLLTRKSRSGTRIQLSMHRSREFACPALHVQLDVVSPCSCRSQPNTARRTLGDEVERSADCDVVQWMRRAALPGLVSQRHHTCGCAHVLPIRTLWQACRQIIVNREKSVPNITIPLIVVSNVDDALIARLLTFYKKMVV
ncbi:hypothetical protein B0H11DRAFT_1931464 [Mycena galericulata]|nr:hypothetical protein B0H11DRAFT_1931464 [Mycena galericulata]